MGKNKFKKKKGLAHRIKRIIKRKIVQLNRSDFFNLHFLVSLLVVLAIFFSLYLTCNLAIEKNMLFWFFAATSQSMAALFAVVGMFAVFRYQNFQTILRHQFDILRKNFLSVAWQNSFGIVNVNILSDSEILQKADNLLKDKKEESSNRAYNNLSVSVLVIKDNKRIMDNIKTRARIPMIAILLTFLVSIFSLLLINVFFSICSINSFGSAVILIMLVLIIYSMVSIFRFFWLSITIR